MKEHTPETVDILEITLENVKTTVGIIVDTVNQLDKNSINPELIQELAEDSDKYFEALKAYINIVQEMSA